MKLASWNVNSLKVRLDQVLEWLVSSQTDVLALQETKLVDEQFPEAPFRERGFHVVFSGQKTYNGVAIISKYPLHDVVIGIPNWDDPQRRVLAATVEGVRVVNVYVPNGAAIGTDKFAYKLMWLEKINQLIHQALCQYPKLAMMGDFNIAPSDLDVHDPSAWEGQVLVSPEERAAFSALLAMGLQDSFRYLAHDVQQFSWWDYRAAAFRRNRGLRIDHILLSDALMAQCLESHIDVEPRRAERPSDHAPVWVRLNLI